MTEQPLARGEAHVEPTCDAREEQVNATSRLCDVAAWCHFLTVSWSAIEVVVRCCPKTQCRANVVSTIPSSSLHDTHDATSSTINQTRMLFLEQTQGFGGGGGNGPHTAQLPSLFELLMQERMASGVKSALEYLVHTATESFPQLSAALPVRRLEETFALLRLLTERYFLTRYDSLATERFYGMKRVSLRTATAPAGNGEAATTTEPLSDVARRQSLLYAVCPTSTALFGDSSMRVCIRRQQR